METNRAAGCHQRYDLCSVTWSVGEETNTTRVYWDGLVMRTSYHAAVDWRWLDGQNRIGCVGWYSPEVESWFYRDLLQAFGMSEETSEEQKVHSGLSWPSGNEQNAYDFVSGSIIANELEKTQINMFHTPGGHGFAAEDANALSDRFWGREVYQVGMSRQLNGADRIVDGIPIQTKYWDSAVKTVNAAFDGKGPYRYNGQLLEVPRDQYAECLGLMREKISAGRVPGVTDPNDAEAIIKKGDVTYRQARNIAKAGNIDGLVFDAKGQFVTSGYAFAISFSINFAKMKWDGKPTDDALADSVSLALQSGGMSLVTGIAVAQVLRTRAAAVGVVTARDGVRAVAGTRIGKGVVERVAQASLSKPIYGAAATNHVAKLLRTNVVTSVVTTVVVSSPDFYRAAFSRSISWGQFGKNLLVNGAGVAGGAGGWMGGAAVGRTIGSTLHPLAEKVGGLVGGIVGSVAGGVSASAASRCVLDGLVEDDAKAMIQLLPSCLEPLASDYMLSESETGELIEAVRKRLEASFLRSMYKSTSRDSFVYKEFEPACEVIIKKRPIITLPDPSAVQSLLTRIQNEAVA